jgi:hypothetical protein
VPLERRLLAVQHQRGAARRALRGGQERNRLLAHARRMRHQVEAREVLPTRLRHLLAVRARVGAHLGVAVVGGRGHDAAAALHDALIAQRAIGVREQLVLAEGAELGHRQGHSRIAAHRLVGGQEQRELVLERDVEGIGSERGGIRAAGGQLGGERSCPGHARLRLRHGDGPLERALSGGCLRAPRRREAPGAADPHAHAKALLGAPAHEIHRAVARGDRLRFGGHVADVGVVGPPHCRVHHVSQDLTHGA